MSFGIIYTYSNFFVAVENEFGLNHATDSTIPGTSLVMFSLGSILAGYLGQKIGFRKTAAIGATLAGGGTTLSSRASSFVEILVSFGIISSLGVALVVLCADTLVVRWFMKKRAAAVSVVVAGAGVGTLVLSPVSNYLILSFGWREAFVIAGSVFLALAVALSYFMQTPEELSQRPLGWAVQTLTQNHDSRNNITLKQALSSGSFRMMYLMFFLGNIGSSMFIIHAVPFGVTHEISAATGSEALGFFGVGSLVARVAVGSWSGKLTRPSSIKIALASEFIGLAALPFANGYVPFFFACSFAIGFGFGGVISDYIALAGDLFGMKYISVYWAS